MPTVPPRPCRHPACPSLVQGGNGYCERHQADVNATRKAYDSTTRRNDPALAFAARIRSSARWRKVAALHKAQSPLCADPFGDHAREGIVGLTEQSHHIIGLAEIYAHHPHEMAFDLGNLAPLCTRCHRKVEARERTGERTCEMFRRKAA